jgi:outer membrane protein assembly factor BamB
MSLSGLVIGNHHIAGFNMSRKLAAFNTDTGEVEWIFTGGGGYSAAGIFVDNRLVIGCDDGKVYCFTESLAR